MKKFFTKAFLTGATAIIVYLMIINFILHMLPNGQYGLFYDEYYYYSQTYHLAFGYLDLPPVTALLMSASRLLMGDSVLAMHVFPAVAGSFTMLFAALTARKMGGGRVAQVLTAVAVMLAPVFMTFSSMFTYDVFDQLMSAMLIFMTAKIIKGEATPRTWILLGLIAGIGLEVKITMGFLLVCLIIGILLTRARKQLAGKWFWISLAIALACFVPYIIWQAMNGFPIYDYLRAYRDARTSSPSAADLLQYVFVVMNPASVLLWLGGLALLFTKRGRIYRPFAWAFIAYFALAAILSVRFYALAGVLLPLTAFGSVCLEKNFRNAPLPLAEECTPQPNPKKKKAVWTAKVCYIAVLCLFGAALTPLSIPLLAPKETADYDDAVGYSRSVVWDIIPFTGIPTYYAGRLGWDELAQTVSAAYHSLPADDQKDCPIYCNLYGAAGAMDYYGKKHGFPQAISANLGCYYMGYDGFDGKCLLYVNIWYNSYSDLKAEFEDVQVFTGAAPAPVPYSTLSLADVSVYVCKGLKIPVDDFWKANRSST